MILLILLYLLPAAAVVLAGIQARARWKDQSEATRWPQFLLLELTVLLVIMTALSNSLLGFVGAILLPAVIGILAALLLLPCWDPRAWSFRQVRALVPYLIPLAALLILLQVLNPPVALYLIIPAALIALTWRAWEWPGMWRLVALLGLLVLLTFVVDLVPSALLARWPESSAAISSIVKGFWPAVAVILAARLFLSIFAAGKRPGWISIALRGAFAVLLLATIAYQIVIGLAWDQMTDGLNSVMITFMAVWAAIPTAMLWIWRSEDWHRAALPGLTFAVVALLVVQIPIMSDQRLDPVRLTAYRAEQVNQAVLRYHEQTGRYPEAVSDLSPSYLWHIPEPIMIRNGTWCYEGGEDYYRLGYVFHTGFGARARVKIQGTAGTLPNPAWQCDEYAATYNASARVPPGQ